MNVFRSKMVGMAISSALVAPAGTFWAQYSGHVEPGSTIGVHTSILIFLFVALGGVGTFWGAILGALVLVPVGELIRYFLGAQVPGLNTVAYGVIVVLVVLFMPKGAVGWWRERRATRTNPRGRAQESAGAAGPALPVSPGEARGLFTVASAVGGARSPVPARR